MRHQISPLTGFSNAVSTHHKQLSFLFLIPSRHDFPQWTQSTCLSRGRCERIASVRWPTTRGRLHRHPVSYTAPDFFLFHERKVDRRGRALSHWTSPTNELSSGVQKLPKGVPTVVVRLRGFRGQCFMAENVQCRRLSLAHLSVHVQNARLIQRVSAAVKSKTLSAIFPVTLLSVWSMLFGVRLAFVAKQAAVIDSAAGIFLKVSLLPVRNTRKTNRTFASVVNNWATTSCRIHRSQAEGTPTRAGYFFSHLNSSAKSSSDVVSQNVETGYFSASSVDVFFIFYCSFAFFQSGWTFSTHRYCNFSTSCGRQA